MRWRKEPPSSRVEQARWESNLLDASGKKQWHLEKPAGWLGLLYAGLKWFFPRER